MKDDIVPEVSPPAPQVEQRQEKRDIRRAVTFGVIMATVQISVLLYFMYC